MRILNIHDEPWDSGLAHYALSLGAELSRRGHEVHFWARAGSVAAAQAQKLGLKTREVSRPWLSLPALRSQMRRARIDVVDAHTGSSHSLGAALCAGGRAALVRTCADARPPRTHALSRALARRTKAFIAANAAIAAHLRRAFPRSRVEEIAQGIAPPVSEPPELPSRPVVGLLGRLDPVKGHETLIEAGAMLRGRVEGVTLRLAGEGRLAPALKAIAASRLPEGACELLGRVKSAAEFIASCRIGCVPSLGSEAVSRAALEWMAMGRPVVASAVGGLPELVDDGVTGLLVKPGDPEELAAALSRVLGEPRLAERMGTAGRRRYQERFGLDVFARRTETLFSELA